MDLKKRSSSLPNLTNSDVNETNKENIPPVFNTRSLPSNLDESDGSSIVLVQPPPVENFVVWHDSWNSSNDAGYLTDEISNASSCPSWFEPVQTSTPKK